MKRLFLSIALLGTFVFQADAQRISGTWHGEMQLNSLKLNLVLHLDGDSVCTVDSPDQGAKGIAGTVKELTAEKAHGGLYSGTEGRKARRHIQATGVHRTPDA